MDFYFRGNYVGEVGSYVREGLYRYTFRLGGLLLTIFHLKAKSFRLSHFPSKNQIKNIGENEGQGMSREAEVCSSLLFEKYVVLNKKGFSFPVAKCLFVTAVVLLLQKQNWERVIK